MLLNDGIIIGDTNECKCTKKTDQSKLKYRLVSIEDVRRLVDEYGKSSLQESADNLADIFLSIK